MRAAPSIAASSRTRRRLGLIVVAAAVSLVAVLRVVQAAPSNAVLTAPTVGAIGGDNIGSTVLSAADVGRYRTIFQLQKESRWVEADREIARVHNRVLLGYVLYQRYMAPRFYSTYRDLASWLQHYASLPGADRIYRLALSRKPARAARPRPPAAPELGAWASQGPRPYVAAPVRAATFHIAPARLDHARWLARVAADRYYAGRDRDAYRLAQAAVKASEGTVAEADWIAGLSAWRLGHIGDAAKGFTALVRAPDATSWQSSAGAYWAARAYLKNGEPQRVNEFLVIAAQYPRTFYGLLASRQLGLNVNYLYNWSLPAFSREQREALARLPGVEQARALAQVGQYQIASDEVRRLYGAADEEARAYFLNLAAKLRLPALALTLGKYWQQYHGEAYDAALFPVPHWAPTGGFTLDPALVYAFMRQESAFRVEARSQVGAKGLMQLMPQTAYAVAEGHARVATASKLYEPDLNIRLGQRYLKQLLGHPEVRDNLVFLAIAYNAGPGGLQHWLQTIHYDNDPLLLVESLPSRETRQFVEHVLTNYWIYSEQLHSHMPTLHALADGNWPYYVATSNPSISVAEDDSH